MLELGQSYEFPRTDPATKPDDGVLTMTKTIDPVTLAVLKGRLEQIADEMDATLYRSAFNPIIAEARDACHGLYHAETGATLVQGEAVADLCRRHGFCSQGRDRQVWRDGRCRRLQPGDTFLFNDPYKGGTHLNDFRLVRPIYATMEVFCWLASVGHWLDIGGNVAGRLQSARHRKLPGGRSLSAGKTVSHGRDQAGHRRHPRRQQPRANIELG